MHVFINTDGGSRGNPGPAAAAFVVQVGEEQLHAQGIFLGQKTNNEAEYEAFLASAIWIQSASFFSQITTITWRLDSKLVIEQLQRHWKIKDARMAELAQKCWQELQNMSCEQQLLYVPREENAKADAVVNQTLDQHT